MTHIFALRGFIEVVEIVSTLVQISTFYVLLEINRLLYDISSQSFE